jgi:hypothetical protein
VVVTPHTVIFFLSNFDIKMNTLFLHFAATGGSLVESPSSQIHSNMVVPDIAAPDVSHVASVKIDSHVVFIS